MTRGTDVTEAFETHHIDADKVTHVLRKYWVASAERPRNVLLTFHADGFYQTLKGRVAKRLKSNQTKTNNAWQSNVNLKIIVFGESYIIVKQNPINS